VKKLLYLLLFLVLLAVVGLFFVDSLAKSAVEKGGTYATGVETKVENAKVGLTSGGFSIAGLSIANPPGYGAEPFFTLAKLETGVSLPTLRRDLIEIPKLEIDGVRVRFDLKDGKPNYAVITENLKRLSTASPASAEKSGKKFVIRELIVRNVTVKADLALLAPVPGGVQPEITLPEIKLKDVGSGSAGGGTSLAELAGVVVTAVLNVAGGQSNFLSPAFAADLAGRLGDLGPLKDQVLGAAQKGLDSALKDLQSQAGSEAQKALDKVGGLLGGKK
jgi:hypothetical protein